MAGLRNAHGICPPEVLAFLMDLFKYNDNSKNRYSDNYYRAALIEALGATVTPVISVQQGCEHQNFIYKLQIKLSDEEITFLNSPLQNGYHSGIPVDRHKGHFRRSYKKLKLREIITLLQIYRQRSLS